MLAAELKKELFQFDAEPFVESSERKLAAAMARQGSRGVVFGASGGIDSLVTAALCLRAGRGGDRHPVVGLQMNDSRIKGEYYNPEMYQELGVELVQVDITDEITANEMRLGLPPHWLVLSLHRLLFKRLPIGLRRKALVDIRAGKAPDWLFSCYRLLTLPHRLRIGRLKNYASRYQLMLVICANRTEASLGYFVEQGVDDSQMGDYAPILNLYKSQVVGTAKFLGLPEQIIKQKPSPGFGGTRDEEILGPYPLVDMVLLAIHRGYSEGEINQAIKQQVSIWTREGLIKKKLFDKGHVQFVRRLAALSGQKRKSEAIAE